jgi:hypothetical protein
VSDAEKSIVQIDDDELATLRANASVCDAATVRLRATLRPGITERDTSGPRYPNGYPIDAVDESLRKRANPGGIGVSEWRDPDSNRILGLRSGLIRLYSAVELL